ncbi:MAG: lipopolysaccharide biosynthesis protein [Alteraurantiacibacter sp. bin_em_oilr2.035]|uniref:lipopolysaccharide biosynthesis protein n=1 Tax=Aurantiacibacter atlanticus TaxID=1648404 RepID=UPI000662B597|nr:lipopolysaccharide biosynthesis protein [Aurantiacibacter atlanticus]MDF1833360.1 lipopolysaccharide biosynthesis protein [Alteraurantiacibacter sp. bin_em_oilr2.035]
MATESHFSKLRHKVFGTGILKKVRWASILHLMTGNSANSALMLLATIIAARALAPENYGVMVLVLAIGRVCERLVRFESWQPLVRFVAEEEERGADPDRIASLYRFGLLLDISSALAAALLAIGSAYLLSGLFGIAESQRWLILIYACAVAVNIRGMPSAVLRLAGRFKSLAYIQLFANTSRLALAVACYFADAGLMAFIIVWTVAQMFDSILFTCYGLWVLHKAGTPSPLLASSRGLTARFPGFLKFAFSTNLSSMLRTMTHEADTLLVGTFAGPAMAGLYHLAKRIAKLALQISDLVQTVAYPDLSRMWSNDNVSEFKKMVLALQILLLGVGVAVFLSLLLLAKPAIMFFFGAEYTGIYPLLLGQVIAVAFMMHASPSRAAMLAMNEPGYVLMVACISSLAFFGVAFAAMPHIGALGAVAAHITFAALTALFLDVAFWRRLARMPDAKELVEGRAE